MGITYVSTCPDTGRVFVVESGVDNNMCECFATRTGSASDHALLFAAAPNLLAACYALVGAYARGEENGGSVDWEDLDVVHELASSAIRAAKGECE